MKHWLLPGLLLALLAQPAPAGGSPAPAGAALQEQLLSGVRAFRGERYEEALSIFHRLEGEGQVTEIGFYLGTTLHKLGRDAEALSAFRAAHRAGLREPVADYYEAVSCYRLGMLARARQGFAALLGPAGGRGAQVVDAAPVGPRLQAGARRFLQAIEATAGKLPAATRYEAALGRAEGLPATSLPEALEWADEAAQVLLELPDARTRAARLPRLRLLLSRVGGAAPALLGEAMALRCALEPPVGCSPR